MYLCLCRGVSETEVRKLGSAGVTRAKELVGCLGLDRPECCRRCLASIRAFVEAAKQGCEEKPDAGRANECRPKKASWSS